jgi:transcriptional regulator with XRE-family HTH domain
VNTRSSPTVRRRRLGIELRSLREQAGLTIEQVAKGLECSDSKISRIENAQVSVTPRDVRDMLDLYGVQGSQLDALVQLARDARQKGWWHSFGDRLSTSVIGLEAAAASIRIYEGQLVPGLLQSMEYAQSVLRATKPWLGSADLEHLVRLRMARQRLLTGDDPPALWLVLDEAVLHRTVGGRQVMSDQMQNLLQACQSPNITIQVLPFNTGEHAGMSGSFTIFGFPEPADSDIVYLDNQTSDLYVETAAELEQYGLLFDYLRAAALPPQSSTDLIAELAKEQ